MRVVPMCELTTDETIKLWRFVQSLGSASPHSTLESMQKSFRAPAFGGGRTYLTHWSDEGVVTGTMGIVTREAAERREVYLTSVFVAPENGPVLSALIDAARSVLASEKVPEDAVIRLAIRTELKHLGAEALRSGFAESTRLLEMRLESDIPAASGGRLHFFPLSETNMSDFLSVHNPAFLASPSGGRLEPDEAEEALREAAFPNLLQVGYLDGVPAAMLELAVEGATGTIEGLAVHPALHGRGLGRETLHQAIATLRAHGATDILLQVVEANAAALHLYSTAGFALARVVSTSYASV